MVTRRPEDSGGRSATFSHRPQPATRPATASMERIPIFSAVMPDCARIVEPRPRQWITPSTTIAAEATAGWATAAEASPNRRGGQQVLRRGRRRGRDRPAEADKERNPPRQEGRQRAVRFEEEDIIASGARQGGRQLAQRQRPAQSEHPADHPEGEHQLVAADEVYREPRRRQDARADHARDDHEGRRRQAEAWAPPQRLT